jgi:hypothetical protein
VPSPQKTTAPSPAADVVSSQTPKNVSGNQAEASCKCERSHIPNELTEEVLNIPDDDPRMIVTKDEDELFRLMRIQEWRSLLSTPSPE